MEDPKQIAASFVEAFNAHDEGRLSELNAESAVLKAPGDVYLEGRELVTGYAMAWLRAFPDARVRVTHEMIVDEWVAQEFVFEGTHEETLWSPVGDFPATHNRLLGHGVQIFRIKSDAIVETRLYFDQVEVLAQLGLMRELATGAA
jgi:predicted ester cyclase